MLDHNRGRPPRAVGIRRLALSLGAVGLLGVGYRAVKGKPQQNVEADAPFVDGDLITVVVGTVGRPSLRDTVLALLKQSYSAVEVVVVDNAPQSGRADEALAGVADPRLTVLREPVRGVSAARNTGARFASGRVVAFTDDDAEPDPQWVRALADVYAADDSGLVSGVTGRVEGLGVDTSDQQWFEDAGIFDKGSERVLWTLSSPESFGAALGEPGSAPLFPYTAGQMGSGNNMSFRRSVFTALNGFDQRIGPGTPTRGGEDLELFRRAILQGGTIVYTPDAVVGHHHRASHSELREQMFGYGSGMSAILTKLVLDGGSPASTFLRRLPIGFKMLLSPETERFADGAPSMPLDLKAIELLGYACGPFLYLRSITPGRRRTNS